MFDKDKRLFILPFEGVKFYETFFPSEKLVSIPKGKIFPSSIFCIVLKEKNY